jgi:predicted nucleic acid-binding protein
MTFFDNRPGAEKVQDLFTQASEGKRDLSMSVVNWGEVYYSIWRVHGRVSARKVAAEISQLPIEIVPADIEITEVAAGLRAEHKLPYADCFGAALALIRNATLVTSDTDFRAVKDKIILSMLP